MTIPLAPSLSASTDPRGLGGLVALVERAEQPLPLRELRVRAEITGNLCRTVVEQRFHNPLEHPAEAVCIFPLPEDGAVVGMELHCGETVVKAEIRAREAAEAEFAAAREAGHRAALLGAERADVHSLRVTMLPPKEEVRVRIELVEVLQAVDGHFRWRFPTTIPPRFAPGQPIGHVGPGAVPDTDAAPDASRLQPPLRLAGGTPLDLEVRLHGSVRGLASSLHAVRLDLDDGLRVAPSGRATLDRDFVLAFRLGEALGSRAWTDGVATMVVVEPPELGGDPLPRDAVFVVDISGSMQGEKLDAAKKALIAALHGLVAGDRFQLLAFDDGLERFAPDFVPYDDRSLARADAWVAALEARGGTVMLPALQQALAGEVPEGRSRTVLFVTDGQAHNDQELVACVSGRKPRARVFTLGIDTAVNGALLSRLARVGGGSCELATPQDDVEALIARVEARFGAPLVEDLRVAGHASAALAADALFPGRPATLFVEGAPTTLRLLGSKGFSREIPVERGAAPIALSWARARIAALEDRIACKPWEAEAARVEIERLGLQWRLASTRTSWIAVERSRKIDGKPVEIVQPAELPSGWDEQFRTGLGATAGAMPPQALSMARTAAPRMARPAAVPAPASAAPRAKKAGRLESLGSFFGLGGAPPPPPAPEAAPAGLPPEVMLVREASADVGWNAAPAGPGAADKLAESAPPTDPAGLLARSQAADGSFGGDALRTAAALLVLVLLGHSRKSGLRTRTVRKAAAWLEAHRADLAVAAALAALEEAEAGGKPQRVPAWDALLAAGVEGRLLRGVVG